MDYKVRYGGMMWGDEEREALIKAADKNFWPLGQEGKLMEQEAADFLGVNHGILANSGSSAGLLALAALELPEGSEVIIPATTFPTIFNIITQLGHIPVVVDSKLGTYNLSPDELEAAISPKTKAIICVHAVGNPCDMPRIMAIAQKHNLYVIEDNCDGWGGSLFTKCWDSKCDEYGGKPTGTHSHPKKLGTFGDISFTSFHAAHIVSMGQGGGVFTNDQELARKARMYRDWGRQSDIERRTNDGKWPELPADYDSRFIYEKIGWNLSPLDIQAAMGRVQLKRTEEIKGKRKANFDYLYEHLSKFEDLVMPKWIDGADPSWFSFPISYWNRGPLVAHLEKNGIETRSMFAGNILKHPAYEGMVERGEARIGGNLFEADKILESSFWISVHPRNTLEDNMYIVKTFDEFFNA